MTPDTERDTRRRRIAKSIIGTITAKDERSKQASIGPSEIGDPCAYCVGKALCRKYPELWWDPSSTPWDEGFSLAAWVGTAIHTKMEQDHPYGVKEQTFVVYELPDYGQISGHVDLVQEHTAVDYKSAWVDNIRKYKLEGPPLKIQFQPHMYGKGIEDAGHTVKDICLFFIPRDNNDVRNCWPAFAPYHRAAAERALRRLEKIWQTVQDGRGGELERDPDCYECKDQFPVVSFA